MEKKHGFRQEKVLVTAPVGQVFFLSLQVRLYTLAQSDLYNTGRLFSVS